MNFVKKFYHYLMTDRSLVVIEPEGTKDLVSENRRLLKLVADQNALLEEMKQENLALAFERVSLSRSLNVKEKLIAVYQEKLEGLRA